MNKITKFLPLSFIILGSLSGCSTGINKLAQFVNSLKDGELSEADVEKIFEDGLILSGNNLVKNATYSIDNYAPFWAYSFQELSEANGVVEDRHETMTFKSYDNGVIETSIDSKLWPFDESYLKDMEEDDGCHVYDSMGNDTVDPVVRKGQGQITKSEDGDVVYAYVQNEDPSDVFSFYDTYADNEKGEMFKSFAEGGGFDTVGASIITSISDVNEQYEYYKTNWTDLTSEEEYKAIKSGKKLEVSFRGDLKMGLYSAERLWAYYYDPEDENYENPGTKKYNYFDGCYVDRRIRFCYDFAIEDGIMTSFNAYYFSYWTTLLRDPNYDPFNDPLPAYPLSEETIADLMTRLVPAGDILGSGEDTLKNPYQGKECDDYLPYTKETYTASKESQGDYDLTKLVDIDTLSHEQDGTDVGAWFDAVKMHDIEDILEY